jgi:DNA-binding NtrC family response regulator
MSDATILIVDDESNIRLMCRTALESEGYQIAEAKNGQEALSALAGRKYDLMILDLNMPVLDGMGVLEQIKTMPPTQKPRVLVLTAYGSIPAAVRAVRMEAIDFLEKPVTPDKLRSAVARVLAEPLPEAHVDDDQLRGGYEVVLDGVRKALRMGDSKGAEELLMKASDLGNEDAAYLNLVGVFNEAKRRWKRAKKFYGLAIRTDGSYEPAQNNMRRIYELETFGKTALPISLGDETALSKLSRD